MSNVANADGYEARALIGRAANGAERGSGSLAHALKASTRTFDHGTALCGRQPGRLSAGWGDPRSAVTCPKCLKRIAKQAASAE
jgi:hypothetical protein